MKCAHPRWRTERVHDHLADARDWLVARNFRHRKVAIARAGKGLEITRHGPVPGLVGVCSHCVFVTREEGCSASFSTSKLLSETLFKSSVV